MANFVNYKAPMMVSALSNALKGSASTGGSSSNSYSYSHTNGLGATANSNAQALTANTTAMNAWREAAEYNAEQARIQREWQERMANTVYQRTVKDMKSAGINPILAANMGLGTASVGSGATASMSNPQTYMGQSFAEQNSASASKGSSWQNSESGLATGLALLGQAISGAIENLSSSKTIELSLKGLEELEKGEGKSLYGGKTKDHKNEKWGIKDWAEKLLDYTTWKNSGYTIKPHN